ncbi:hypothetical protein FE257_004032 [Aspergillus nanangensis]|uniref:Uncharacterized protein n=1 Tax=Aspergillus nanangensis TaxID=2582783 RepID=A0AAD4CSE6_ASPNN|nr:hypothetical protein FE257_004032 [Aspergillus nanangensis]
MYETAPPLDLKYIKERHLPQQYDSEEEEISESEQGGQENENAFSPVESYKAAGTFDSDASADEMSNADTSDSEGEKAAQFARLLPPYSSAVLASRPVSMDTVKRSSGTTFAADSYIFDHDDDVIIELPSPNSTSPMQSPTFLQPTVYVPPESPASSRRPSSRSSDRSSMLSDDDTDVFVAEQVTFVKPRPKPNLILISPVSEQSFPFRSASAVQTTFPENDLRRHGSPDSFYSLQQGAKSQPLLGNTKRDTHRTRSEEKRGSLQLSLRGHEGQPIGPAARTPSNPLSSLAEVPEYPRPMSVRSQSISCSRPKTAFSEKASLNSSTRSRQNTPGIRRPPSLQSLSSVFHSRQASAFTTNEDYSLPTPISYSHSNASSEYSVPSPTSRQATMRTPSPTSYYNSPNYTRDRSGSVYSASSTSGSRSNRTRLPIRNSMMKSSTASSLYSGSSLRSEVDSVRSLDPNDVAETQHKQKSRRKKSLRANKLTKPDEQTSTKSFMGFMFRGKRRSTINSLNA